MGKSLSFWAALASIDGLLLEDSEWVYLWTLTGATNEVRQDRKRLMRCWNRLMQHRSWRALGVRGYRATEQGGQGEMAWHIHFVTDKWLGVDQIRAAAEGVGFGRLNVKRLPRSAAGYAAKYLTKTDPVKGHRRWASFGGAAKVRCKDIVICDQFRSYAIEPRQWFPGKSEGSAAHWWAECLYGLACAFMRQPYGWKLPRADQATMDRYGGLDAGSEAAANALNRLLRPKGSACFVDGRMERGRGVRAKTIYPAIGLYVGRWVPEFTATDKRTGRTWARRHARHLVSIGGVPWWVREPGDVASERPAQPGDLVMVGFLQEPRRKEQKICGEAVGYVEGMHPPLSKPDDFEAEIDRICRENPLGESDTSGDDICESADSSFAIIDAVGHPSDDE